MSVPSRGTKSAGGTAFATGKGTILSSEVDTDFDNLFNWADGNVENDNIGASAAIALTKLAGVTSTGQNLMTAASASAARTTLSVTEKDDIPASNVIYNGDFRVWQRGTTFDSTTTPANSDDTYLADRWILLSDGNDVVDVSKETSTVPSGASAAIALDVETANKKFGILQILENEDTLPLRSQTVSLSFKARTTGSSITRIRAAVVEWSGTADSVTSDLVSAWGADEANPTPDTNWAFSDTPAQLTALTNSYQTYTIEGITTGSGATNIGVFIWMNSIDGSNPVVADVLYIADVQLQVASTASVFHPRPYEQEFQICQRYYWRLDEGGSGTRIGAAVADNGTNNTELTLYPPTTMRAAPTVTASAGSTFNYVNSGQSVNTVNTVDTTAKSISLDFERDVGNWTADTPIIVEFASAGGGSLEFDAEL